LNTIDLPSHENFEETIPVTMPNGNIVMFPSNLYIFFEATSLADASPSFVSKVGLVMTEDSDLDWENLLYR